MKTAREWTPRLAINSSSSSPHRPPHPSRMRRPPPACPGIGRMHISIFSHPGTADEALRNHTYDRWLTIANDPRYMIQLQKRIANATRFYAAQFFIHPDISRLDP